MVVDLLPTLASTIQRLASLPVRSSVVAQLGSFHVGAATTAIALRANIQVNGAVPLAALLLGEPSSVRAGQITANDQRMAMPG